MPEFVNNNGVQLCVERRGSGARHVLFAHGWISSRRMWYDAVEKLDGTRITAHLLDFRGSGLSDRPPHGHHLEGYASDLRAALASIGEPVTLVAHSMGARIAQYVAAHDRAPIERLILVAPGVASGRRVSKRRAELAREAFGNRTRIEAFQRAAMSVEVSRETMDRLVEDALVAQREVWFGDPERPGSIDFSDALANIRVPALCIAGANDPLAPPLRLKSDVVARIPGAMLVTLRNAGHNLPVEMPAEIAGAIGRFI